MRSYSHHSLIGPSAGAIVVATMAILPMFLVGALAVQLSVDLGVPASALGVASAAFFGAGTLASPLAGSVAVRFGTRATMRFAVLLVGMVLIAAALGVRSLTTLVAVMAIGGVANALAQPAVNLYLAQRIAPRHQGTAYGIKQSAVPVAGMLAGLAVPALGLTIGWRWAFMLFVLPAVLLMLFTPGNGEIQNAQSQRLSNSPLPRKTLGMLALGGGIGAGCAVSLSVFAVAGAVEAGWSEAQAGLIFAYASAAGILARLVSGIRADRRGEGHLKAIACMLVTGALGFVTLAVGHPLLYAIGAPIAFGFGWGWPGLLIHAAVQLSPSSPAAGTAQVQVGTSAGSVLGPLACGSLIEHFSYAVGWSIAGVGLLVAAATVLVAQRVASVEAATGRGFCSSACRDAHGD